MLQKLLAVSMFVSYVISSYVYVLCFLVVSRDIWMQVGDDEAGSANSSNEKMRQVDN